LAEGTPPHMLFSELVEKYLDDEIRADVDNLLKLKMQSPEIGTGNRIDNINSYIEANISDIENQLEHIPYEKERDWQELDKIFLSLF
jgi:hypothetical protein